MKIHILRDGRVGEIKKQFSSEYPFLKLEFLVHEHGDKQKGKQMVVSDSRKISEIHSGLEEGSVEIGDATTVSELESFFRDHLLDVQVFRRSDNLWLETTMTDKWTLEKQNTHGREITESKYPSRTRQD